MRKDAPPEQKDCRADRLLQRQLGGSSAVSVGEVARRALGCFCSDAGGGHEGLEERGQLRGSQGRGV